MAIITTLDVMENYFGKKLPDFSALPQNIIDDFGQEIRAFASSYSAPKAQHGNIFPSFLGGWPSANWAYDDSLLMTSLLYSGQVLVSDPLIDWFCDEQYENSHLVRVLDDLIVYRSRSGYKQSDNPEYNLTQTRDFLSRLIPYLLLAKPLIQSGVIVMAPTKIFEYEHQKRIVELADSLLGTVIPNVKAFTKQFRPSEIPITELRRGMFLIRHSSNIERIKTDIQANIRVALRYFASEFLYAQHYGFDYTTSYRFEQYVCQSSLNTLIEKRSGFKVFQGMLHSKFPLYQGLTPAMVFQIRDDDNFAMFRHDLYQIYARTQEGLNNEVFAREIHEAEEALLRPRLIELERNERKGPLSKMGFTRAGVIRWAATIFARAAGAAIDPTTGVDVLGEILEKLADRDKATGSSVVWKRLFDHGRSMSTQHPYSAPKNANAGKAYWGIPREDGNKVSITEGYYLRPLVSENPAKSEEMASEIRVSDSSVPIANVALKSDKAKVHTNDS